MGEVHLVVDKLKDLKDLKAYRTKRLVTEVQGLQDRVGILQHVLCTLSNALNGDLQLTILKDTIEISADVLNAAVTGTFKIPISVSLDTSGCGEHHHWAGFEFVATPAKVTGDPAAPTIVQDPVKFERGKCLLDVLFATDEGVTPYDVGDEYNVTFKVAADDKWHGITVTPKVVTFNIV